MGPRTLLKWRIRGMRLERKRVSIITAALALLSPRKGVLVATMLFSGLVLDVFAGFAEEAVLDGGVGGE